jgi:hypothetical protein
MIKDQTPNFSVNGLLSIQPVPQQSNHNSFGRMNADPIEITYQS